MYNRYIPQSDGSYRRNRIQEPSKEPPRPVTTPPPPPSPPVLEQEPPQCGYCIHKPQRPPLQSPAHTPHQTCSVSHFLKQLLPKNFDLEDLLVILMLLIMAGDCQEDQNTALLTLALYLFL